jgi:zinc protease
MNQENDFRAQPPAPLPATPIKLPTPYEAKLPNGLGLVVVEDDRLPLVSYRLSFRTGDAHDPKGLPGLTDMMAALLNEGTESRSSLDIANEVELLGATLHAGAGSDYTTVAASALSVFGDRILELMADVTLRPSFPENEVELAKQNTKESLKQQRAQPSFLANEMVARVMFGEHPYSVIAPTPESLEATTRQHLVDFHRAVFVPNNAVFMVVGDVQATEIHEQIEKLFGAWQPGTPPADRFSPPPERVARVTYLIDRPGSAQSNIVIANNGMNRTDPDYFPLLLMHTVLGGTASARLFMNLREEKGYTYGAYSNLDARRAAGTFRATAEVRSAVTGDSLKEFFYELERIGTEPVSEKEIKDAKSYLTGVFPLRLETQEGLIDQLVQIKMMGLSEDHLETYRDRVQAVTREQIQHVAQKYVRPEAAAIVIVGDAAEVLEQIKPYCEDIRVFNTAGKPKELPAPGTTTAATDTLAGIWTLEIQTPFGQDIPATLTLVQENDGFTGKIESEMGSGKLADVVLNGKTFQATLSFEMEGHSVSASITGSIDGPKLNGTISLQGLPELTFTGVRDE